MNKILTVILMIFMLSTSYAGTIRHDVDEQEYLKFGQEFFCVKKLVLVQQNPDQKNNTASCVILNKHWCITAAHITEEEFDCIKVVFEDKEYCLDKIIVHKNFQPELNNGDIALGFCSEGFEDIPFPQLNEEKVEIEQICSIAGFGQYGNMKTGAKIIDGKIRAGSNRISYRYNDMLMCEASEDDPTILEFLPNIGDSGGGLFVNGKLSGITCLIFGKNGKADSTYGDEAGFVEIYPYLEWIKNHVKKTQM